MSLSQDGLSTRRYVPYLDLGGGLNTKKDAHALNRNQLALSVNCWYAGAQSVSKRPGSAAVVTGTGATGSGVGAKSLVSARFSGSTYFIVQCGAVLYAAKIGDVAFTNIGTLPGTPGAIQAAQMYDPDTSADTLFIVDGVNQPYVWKGPGFTISAMAAGAGSLPTKLDGTGVFSPAYVTTIGNNSHLVFSGDSTAPNALYISNALFPTRFQSNSTLSGFYLGTYIPYFIGQNDGVNGGKITGISTLGSAIIVFKESAIYRLLQMSFNGDLIWRCEIVSASVGALSPRSVTRFDDFIGFLGIDGAYITDGIPRFSGGYATRKVSDNVPTFFDSTLNGTAAVITGRTTAVGLRHGNRFLLFYDDSNAGYPTTGIWFDFNKPDESGLPCAGQITNMKVGGAIPLRSSGDDGNFIWADAAVDRVGKFGIGFSDYGSAIQTTFAGKADFFADFFPDKGPICEKVVQDVTLCISLPQVAAGESVQFTAAVVTDLLSSSAGTGIPVVVTAPGSGVWGGNWGTMTWTSSSNANQYQLSKIPSQDSAMGHVIQFIFQESSVYPWTCLGYVVELNAQEIAA